MTVDVTGDLKTTLECHANAATVYARGTLSALDALRVVHACHDLPREVRALRVDLRDVRPANRDALDALALGMGEWRARRRGFTRLDLPRTDPPAAG